MPLRPAPRPNKHKPTPAPRSKITLPPNTPKNYKPKKIWKKGNAGFNKERNKIMQ